MCKAIRQFAGNHNQPLPETEGEFTRCIFESLALKYRIILDQINSMRPEKIEQLHIVGGGSQNSLLNQYTANALGIPVLSGPVEATAIGNIAVQGIARGVVGDLNEAREMVRESFELAEFEPQEPDRWEEPYARFRNLFGYN
jgi:rhamnulokinase